MTCYRNRLVHVLYTSAHVLSEIGCCLQVIGIQPVCTVLLEHLPHSIARVDWPPRSVPESRGDATGVGIPHELCDVSQLRFRDGSNAVPSDGDFVVRRSKRRQRRIPGSVQRWVSQLRQGRVEKVIAWRECFDLLERAVTRSNHSDCRLGQGAVGKCREVPCGAEGLKRLKNGLQSSERHQVSHVGRG